MPAPFATQVASSVPFDNTTSGLAATDVQAAIEEVRSPANGVTPPFIFTNSSSSLSNGSYLTSGQVPGNKTGQLIPGNNKIVKLAASNGSDMTLTGKTFQVQKRTGVSTFADIAGATITIPAGTYKASSTVNIVLGTDEEISVYLKSGTGAAPNGPIVMVFLSPN